jgi:hypothetical protein
MLEGVTGLIGAVDVESRNGCLYCQMCDDFVFDPTLEDLRLRKSGKGLSEPIHIILKVDANSILPYSSKTKAR